MKLHTPEKNVLMDVTAIKTHPSGLLIEGRIMGTLPMKAILNANELRSVFKIMKPGVLLRAMKMIFVGRS